jgi:leader peptidase (prepilin peptidase)/N-methyltransferase
MQPGGIYAVDIVLATVGGLMLGSFFNVVIWRLPRGESLVAPGSHCPGCGTPVRPYDNVPVLSWLLLGGRCRSCAAPISVRYPSVEILTALLTTAVALFTHSAHDIALYEVLVLVLVPVALIDLDHRIIPNVILVPAALAAVLAGVLTRPSEVPEQLIAGAAAATFLLVFALAYPGGMGLGDVKLAGVLGLFLGRSVAVAILAALVFGVVAGIGIIGKVGVERGRTTAVAFGPFLSVGAIVAIFFGAQVVQWYLHSVI